MTILQLYGPLVFFLVVFAVFWINTPKRIDYYFRGNRISFHRDDNWNLVARSVHGRLRIWFFCFRNDVEIDLAQRIAENSLERFLAMIGVPDPWRYSSNDGLGAVWFYPMGETRLQYLNICWKHRLSPWEDEAAIRALLRKGGGYLLNT